MRTSILAAAIACLLASPAARADEPVAAPAAAPMVAAEPVPDKAADPRPTETGTAAKDDRTFWELIGEDNPNPATYDIAFISIAVNKSWGLARWSGGGIYFGAGGGLGTPFYRIVDMGNGVAIDSMLEAVFGNVFMRVSPFPYADLDVGGRLALGAATFDVSDAPRGGFVRGGYADLRVGSRKVKFGPRFEYDNIVYSDFEQSGWKLTPLMLRVVND